MKIWAQTACATVDQLKRDEISPQEVLQSIRERFDEVNPVINALPTTCFERAADFIADLAADAPGDRGVLGGLPVPIKDSYEVEGVRTTWGSLAFSDHIASRSNYLVEAIENSGGVVYAKSNTPEFEAGANTFNDVFGYTRNPWNTALSVSGSSGGAAAAVLSGMAFVAQGSDFACSLRYPAAFCGIVGLRPSPGIVPQGPSRLPHQVLSVIGPLARNVEDVALALDAMTAFDMRDPLSRPRSGGSYRQATQEPNPVARVAFSMDFGFAVVSETVQTCVRSALDNLARTGVAVVDARLDLSDADSCFRTLRAYQFAASWSETLKSNREQLKPEVVWNIEEGLKLTAGDIAKGEALRAEIRQSVLALFDDCDFLISPATPVEAFPVEERYVSRIGETELKTYLDWLALGYAVTVTGCPSISIPCGKSPSGLPVGIQIVGRPYDEFRLLNFAAYCESVLGAKLVLPIDPKTS